VRLNWFIGPPGFWLVKVSVPVTMVGEGDCAVLILKAQLTPDTIKGISVRLAADRVAEKE